jgi:peroxiredoxin
MNSDILRQYFFISEFEKELKDGVLVYPTFTATFEEITKKRTIILTLPGAFTPICTFNQVPEFEVAALEIKNLGIEEIYILTSNDFFTQRVWADAMRIKKLKFISDIDLIFAKNFNNLIYRNVLGLRSRRELFIFNDNKIEYRFSEEYDTNDDPYENTKLENLFKYLTRIKHE